MIQDEWDNIKRQFEDFFPTAIQTFGEEFREIWNALNGLCNGVNEATPELMEEIYRKLHTAKGTSAQTGFNSLAKIVHSIEDHFIGLKKLNQQVDVRALYQLADMAELMIQLTDELIPSKSDIKGAHTLLIRISELAALILSSEGKSAETSTSSEPAAARTKVPPMAIDDSQFDAIFQAVSKTLSVLAKMRDIPDSDVVPRNEKALSSLIEARLSSPTALGSRLKRMVRSLADDLSKDIQFETKGFEQLVDRKLLGCFNEILTHMLRNSLDHGIEEPSVRQARGKPALASVSVEIVSKTDKTSIIIKDDGAGIDPDRVARKAVENGLVSSEEIEKFTRYEKQSLIFKHGFSTKSEATEISGRGVGMDAVMAVIENNRGNLIFQSEPGEGSTFVIDFPSDYRFDQVVIFTLGGQNFFISSQNTLGFLPSGSGLKVEMGALSLEDEPYLVLSLPHLPLPVTDSDSYMLLELTGVKIALNVDAVLAFEKVLILSTTKHDKLPAFISGIIDSPKLGFSFGIDITELERNFNLYFNDQEDSIMTSPDRSEPKDVINAQHQSGGSTAMNLPSLPRNKLISKEKILAFIEGDEMTNTLREIIVLASQEIPTLVDQLIAFAESEISLLTDTINSIEDEEELQYVLAIRYAALKSNWILLNLRVNYELAAGKESEPILPFKAALSAGILGRLESLILADAVKCITQVLSEPVIK
ncbi:MAG: Hpt domain-containing protein [Oligoflexus sp.]|nr:Hpt domain-containing protein [Oligoflexus sp.]